MDTQAGYFGSTQLHIAVSRGREKTAVLLLRAGASPNMRDESGDSALHLVCGPSGRSDLVELLLGHGASINVQNRDGNTPLIIALQRGNGLARRLLELPEIETHHTNNKGDNALVAACSRGDLNILYILLRFRLGELGRLF
ncbi:Ankyrin repeat protein [Seminavis robusta]|uniref:Ankyrin repeat protein n=1 Tax=Seminavis robusta TaxID=568900 RepID=A0A9N8EMR3_9STRA|nr:Ankyrin repeat protein [Seminavis robusta]|eukprot:Sro1233_g254810.1 Ankyrin repeat protein (141) ;mRNA; f:20408-20830